MRGHTPGDKVDPAKRSRGFACAYVVETAFPTIHLPSLRIFPYVSVRVALLRLPPPLRLPVMVT